MKKTIACLLSFLCTMTIFPPSAQAKASEASIITPSAADVSSSTEQKQVTTYGIFPKPFRFESRSDWPHISSSRGARAASVHGWWNQISGPAGTATVRIELWAKGPRDRWFRKVGVGTKHAIPGGGGRGNRATARAVCKNHDRTIFRGDVDVDINNYPDPPGIRRGYEVPLPCGV